MFQKQGKSDGLLKLNDAAIRAKSTQLFRMDYSSVHY
jgi:hypothetical protein